jgi:hypothetical protein
MNTNNFMDECIRINKPCKFEGLAKSWVAYDKWRLTNGGVAYLSDQLKDQVTVYVNMDDEYLNAGVASGNSFSKDSVTKMKYSEFI